MNLRFIAAIAVIFLACIVQLWLSSIGIIANLILVSLVSLSFLFGFWELIFFILLALFIVNWQPAPSEEIILFALIPIGAYLLRKFSSWQAWVGNLIAICGGLVIVYGVLDFSMITANVGTFFMDLALGLLFGAAVFSILNRRATR